MTLSTDAQPLAYGVPIHPVEHQRYLDRTRKSWELLNRTRDLIPTGHAGGMWYQMPYPVLLNKGKGSRVWDVDGNEYLDLRIGDWVLIHGHANEQINEAVTRQLPLGSQSGSREPTPAAPSSPRRPGATTASPTCWSSAARRSASSRTGSRPASRPVSPKTSSSSRSTTPTAPRLSSR